MNEKYLFIAYTEDKGNLQDGTPWTGRRIVAQIERGDSRQTVVLKASKQMPERLNVNYGDYVNLLYDRNGRVAAITSDHK